MAEASYLFDRLNEWSQMDSGQLKACFGPEAIGIVVSCSKLLLPAPLATDDITADKFIDHIAKLRLILVQGSQSLGNAINRAGDSVDHGDPEAARTVLRSFLARCEAPFYRQIAERRLAAIGHNGNA